MPEVWQSFEKTFLIAVRESFIALLPILFINSFLALVLALVELWTPIWIGSEWYVWVGAFIHHLLNIFPLFALLSLSFHFAKYLNLSGVVLASVSIATLLALHIESPNLTNFALFTAMFSDPRVMLIPVISAYILKGLVSIERLNLLRSVSLSAYLRTHLNLFLPLLISFFLVTLAIFVSSDLLEAFLSPYLSEISETSLVFQLFIRVVVTHILWCFGVHGDIAYLMLIGVDNGLVELVPNLGVAKFMDLFVLFGGSGATLSLVIAILIGSKDHNSLNVAKLSIPFAMFNINEILIYGLPIIFNPKLIPPFIILPVINTTIGYLAISSGFLVFEGNSFPWVTPALLNGYIASGGFTVVLLQLFLITLGVFIYLPFVKQYNLLGTTNLFERDLAQKVLLQGDMDRIAERNYSQNQSQTLAANRNLERTIKEVLNGELLLHYQPKVLLNRNKVTGFEALLRLRTESGEVVGPYFIQEFEKAGYAKLIDHFVINTVAEDLNKWGREKYYPSVSINLNPNNLLDSETQALLIHKLDTVADRVEIELLESTFINDLEQVEACMTQLQGVGFKFLLDDFGTGFSSISLLSKIKVDGVKLDRSILENITDAKGRTLYNHTCMLCQSLGFILIAEGVETKQEAKFVRLAGVDYVQGWLYAKAMPREEAKRYALLSKQYETDARG